jgi:hypothetical protein
MHAQKCEMAKKYVPLAKYLFGTVTGNAGQIARNHNFCMEEQHLSHREQTIKACYFERRKIIKTDFSKKNNNNKKQTVKHTVLHFLSNVLICSRGATIGQVQCLSFNF